MLLNLIKRGLLHWRSHEKGWVLWFQRVKDRQDKPVFHTLEPENPTFLTPESEIAQSEIPTQTSAVSIENCLFKHTAPAVGENGRPHAIQGHKVLHYNCTSEVTRTEFDGYAIQNTDTTCEGINGAKR